MNWTRYIEELYTGRNHIITDLSSPEKVEIAVEEVDLFVNMMKYFYKKRKLSEIGI